MRSRMSLPVRSVTELFLLLIIKMMTSNLLPIEKKYLLKIINRLLVFLILDRTLSRYIYTYNMKLNEMTLNVFKDHLVHY